MKKIFPLVLVIALALFSGYALAQETQEKENIDLYKWENGAVKKKQIINGTKVVREERYDKEGNLLVLTTLFVDRSE